MIQEEKLKAYCKQMLLEVDIDEGFMELDDKIYKIVDDDQTIFDEELDFILDSYTTWDEETTIEPLEEDCIGWVYEFGGRWYLQNAGEDVSLQELKYIGKAVQQIPTKSFLGIRSGYELLNGIGLYKDWIKKAKFLGTKALGICEKGTLAGVIEFQNECKSNDIKSIIGLTVPVISNQSTFDIKLYAKDFQGWLNLLKFNAVLNVDKDMGVSMDFLGKNCEGLFVVADPKQVDYRDVPLVAEYYQLDTPNFLNEEKDAAYIDNMEAFINSKLEPILINDAFYLEKDDYIVREMLWTVGKAFDDKTDNQYFKNRDQFAKELIVMFEEDNKGWIKLYKKAEANLQKMVEECNFQYDTDTRHLPKYIMREEEAAQFKTNANLFLHLIKKGFKDRKIKDAQKYIDRLKMEIKVLQEGDVIDYFLVLYDIIQYARKENILTGIGRGSAGGSLVAYLMDIIQIDPLEFDLLFERFLNSGRMGEWQDRPCYTIELESGLEITLSEGSMVRIKKGSEETVVFVHELKEGDDIIKY